MELPVELRDKLEGLIENQDVKKIKELVSNVSEKYRQENRDASRFITSVEESIAYALYRMPATYLAIYSALTKMQELNEFNIETALDFGAGTGAGEWAIKEVINPKRIIALEKDNNMMQIGKNITEGLNVEWKSFNLLSDDIDEKADLVLSAYVLNELPNEKVEEVILKLWNYTNKVLVLVDVGTPNGYQGLMNAREILIKNGGYTLAPCTHNNKCMLKDDWCNNTCRVPRSKLHKYLKDSSLPYEDEKYMYIIMTKEKYDTANMRVLRHPNISKGNIKLKVCKEDGIEEITITKKDKELYKAARKVNAGDKI